MKSPMYMLPGNSLEVKRKVMAPKRNLCCPAVGGIPFSNLL